VNALLKLLSLVAASLSLFAAIISIFNSGEASKIAAEMAARGGMDVFGSDLDRLLKSMIKQGAWTAASAGLAATAAFLNVALRFAEVKRSS